MKCFFFRFFFKKKVIFLSFSSFILMLCSLFFSASEAFAMSATNVQPSNLVQSNATDVHVSFRSTVTLPSNGKVKVTFPSGFDITKVDGADCSTMNGDFFTAISGQTVILTRDNMGSPALAGIHNCIIHNVLNPSSIGSTGTYTIKLFSETENLLEEDTMVSSDQIISPGLLNSTNIEPEVLIQGIHSRYTVTFTSVNPIVKDGHIIITFPSGFDVSAAKNARCLTMNGDISIVGSGQNIILTREGNGTDQSPAVEACTIDGIVAPEDGVGGEYKIMTQDRYGHITDENQAVRADTFVHSGTLTATHVKSVSNVTGAYANIDISFTTPDVVPINARINIIFPFGYDISSTINVNCPTLAGSESFVTSGQVLTILRTSTLTEALGVETCTATNIRNPQISGETGLFKIQIVDDQNQIIYTDDRVASDTLIPGTLPYVNVQPENLVTGITSLHTLSLTNANPIPGDGKMIITFPSSFDISAAHSGNCFVMDGTIHTFIQAQSVILVREGGSVIAPKSVITCMIKDIRAPLSAGSAGTYIIKTQTGNGIDIDVATAASDTFFVASSLTRTDVQPISRVRGVTNDVMIKFTTPREIPEEGKIHITFGSGYDVSQAFGGNCVGFDGNLITSVNGQTITLMRTGAATTSIASAKICTIYGIKNPESIGSTGIYTITLTDKHDVMIASSEVSSDTIINSGTLTNAEIEPSSLIAGVKGQVNILFSAINGIPSGGKIHITFPSGFDIRDASDPTCTLFNEPLSHLIDGQVLTLIRDDQSQGIFSGMIFCSVQNIKNPEYTLLTEKYQIKTTDEDDVLISSALPSADRIAPAVLRNVQIKPDTTLIDAINTISVDFISPNTIPADGKIVMTFPQLFSLTEVGHDDMKCAGLSGKLTVSVTGNTIIALRSEGEKIKAGVEIHCDIAHVKNPSQHGEAGRYMIKTTTYDDKMIAQAIDIASNFFVDVDHLTQTNVQPETLIKEFVTTNTILFVSPLPIPRNGKILITYPKGFDVTKASHGYCENMNGDFMTSVSEQTVTITRSKGISVNPGPIKCMIYQIKNPIHIGPTGTYRIELQTASGRIIAFDSNVSSDDIWQPKNMQYVKNIK